MRENAFCMVFHSSSNPTVVATRLGRDSETRGEKNPSHMENHTKCISGNIRAHCLTLAVLVTRWLIPPALCQKVVNPTSSVPKGACLQKRQKSRCCTVAHRDINTYS